jgi:hypothetical protein
MRIATFILQVCGWLIGLPLQVLVVAALLRGSFKRFPFVFAYAVASLVITVIEIPSNVNYFITQDENVLLHFAKIYWWDERILLVLVFVLVISLIHQALALTRSRQMVSAGLIAGALLFAVISFFIHHTPHLSATWTLVTRDMNFGAAILDVGLWSLLIASRRGDRRLLLISGALGLQFTGEAIGESIRNLSLAQEVKSVSLAGSVIVMLADLACLYVWWRTFSAAARHTPSRI